jgi:hypothetical protein
VVAPTSVRGKSHSTSELGDAVLRGLVPLRVAVDDVAELVDPRLGVAGDLEPLQRVRHGVLVELEERDFERHLVEAALVVEPEAAVGHAGHAGEVAACRTCSA